MSAVALPSPQAASAPPLLRVGRAFVHPAFDLLVIGGGLSLLFTAALLLKVRPPIENVLSPALALVVLVSNQAHFAASTVRLYTKPGARRDLRFLSLGFPLVTLAVLTYAVARPEGLGASLTTLYLTWSPYHYGAQAYGLALMYAYRSGCTLEGREKQIVRAACLAPFLAQVIAGPGLGVDWLLVHTAAPDWPWLRVQAATGLSWAPIVLMLILFSRAAIARRATLPLISVCTVISNAVWLIWLPSIEAFAYATIFHAVQYLAIVTIFHVKSRPAVAGSGSRWAHHAGGFYLRCVALGYVLFQLVPLAYLLLGFGLAESALVVITIINLHHFIVDAYVWKLRQDSNYKVVADAA
jgi:hypothetical protein